MKKIFTFSLILLSFLFFGWGSTGHKMINKKSVESFPQDMNEFLYWVAELEANSMNADNRKGTDPNEAPKHYIDIDNYPSFINDGRIPQTWDSVVAIYGYNFVIDQGILPWAIMTTIDTLQKTFERRDWTKAILTAADLGHYVADGHMPLHITRNYNGQYTGQNGIHSRYESNMINRYQNQINYSGDSVSFVENINEYVFSFLYRNYIYVDSVLYADSAAKAFAGNTTSDLYYQKMWDFSKEFTVMLFDDASRTLAELIYTAWINAGSPTITTEAEDEINKYFTFNLEQNYPNPFNPSTVIRYHLPCESKVSIKVYNILGKEVSTLVNEIKEAGVHEIKFTNDGEFSSGVYFYTIETEGFTDTKKFVMIK
ncbi:MAG: hypothetical protein A2W11_04645 [Ignavibacteria bacterium RBG_16_35_7]|nr:MAG: hypothetical protein A2W11_04645 [Ignavibacteria bacterium RBG_16_35_7]